MYFEDLRLSEDILDALYDMKFEKCTPIQERCIPLILEGKDVVGIAQTGTGKTAAYLLPLMSILQNKPHDKDRVNCLIMAPTRELAQQIDQALQGFGYYTNISGVAIYGGNDGIRYEQERKSLQMGADIVIATPGRLLTHIDLGTLSLSGTTHLVLDEADRMLDMGFADDILKIVSHMPKDRQTVLFSATMPEKTAELAHAIMHNPQEVKIAVSKPADNIKQTIYHCSNKDKNKLVEHILTENVPHRLLLFASKKTKVKELAIQFTSLYSKKGNNQIAVGAMHSDLDQKDREKAILAFKAGRIQLLIATDIVARGIDIDDIDMIINYDAPKDAEDYVHRIGRTARAGRSGQAITLIGEDDFSALRNIERLLGKKIPQGVLPEGLSAPSIPERHTSSKRTKHKTKRNNNSNDKSSAKSHKSHQKNNKSKNNKQVRNPQNPNK